MSEIGATYLFATGLAKVGNPPRADLYRGYQASDFMRGDQAGLPKEERAPVRAVLPCRKAVPAGSFIVLSLCALSVDRGSANTCVRRKLEPGRKGRGPKAGGGLGAPSPRWWGNAPKTLGAEGV